MSEQTSGGVPLTDETVQRLADEAERGYDVNQVRRRPPSEGSRRCMIYRFAGDTVQESLRTVDDNNGTTGRKA